LPFSQEADIADAEAEDAAVAAEEDVAVIKEDAAVDVEVETLHTLSVPRKSPSSISESIWIKRFASNTVAVVKVCCILF
jgi:hypothetical protein